MMNASFEGHYNTDKSGAVGTFVVNGGDVRLKTSVTEATFANGISLSGLALSVEKPGSFIIDYDIPKQDVRFQFMNRVRILEKQLNLTYTHMRGDNKTSLDGTLVIDDVNKVSMNYGFDTGNCKLKYSYVHGGVRTFEPTYDFAKNSWDFAVSQRVYGDDVVRASYQSFSRVVGVEWSRPSGLNGAFKITASLNLAEESKIPKLCAESTWNVEL